FSMENSLVDCTNDITGLDLLSKARKDRIAQPVPNGGFPEYWMVVRAYTIHPVKAFRKSDTSWS
ncbi:hypothetical protein, partial [Acidithiobacillus caldus]|uniref:hypothetical protein n=1 Tax=Acidithiobacillus caldus TaxID=33059 RepID=UPI001C072701